MAHDETEGVPHGMDGIMHHRKRCEKKKIHRQGHPQAEKQNSENANPGKGRDLTGRFDRLNACGLVQRTSPYALSDRGQSGKPLPRKSSVGWTTLVDRSGIRRIDRLYQPFLDEVSLHFPSLQCICEKGSSKRQPS